MARCDRELGSQIRRALSSVGLNISEGFGSAAGNARLRFERARGSLYEAQAGLQLAIAWGYLSAQDCSRVLAAIDPAGFAYSVAYSSRCGHAFGKRERERPGTFHHLLASHGERLLEL